MRDTVIRAKNLTKVYKLYKNPVDRLKESLHPLRKKYHQKFYALDDLSFEIKQNEALGIIGKNGAGKSTLLKILAGILTPTSGTIERKGKASALLELGAGFNPELSGVENVYFSGLVTGHSREDMDGKIDDIIHFADIGAYIEQPVKTYSSGMYARLAFSVSVFIDPEILIIDEILSVGDLDFQVKSMNKIRELMDRCTVVFVSHNLESVKEICNRAIMIDGGKIKQVGKANDVVKYYHWSISNNKKTIPANSAPFIQRKRVENYRENKKFLDFDSYDESQRFGDKNVIITNVEIVDEEGHNIDTVALMHRVYLRIHLKFFISTDAYNIGFHCENVNGVKIFGMRTNEMMTDMPYKEEGDTCVVEFAYTNRLQQDVYSISVAVSNRFKVAEPEYHDWINAAISFRSAAPENTVWGVYYENNGQVLVR